MENFKQTTKKDLLTGKKIDEYLAGQTKFYYIAKREDFWNYEKYWDNHVPVVIPTVPDKFESYVSVFIDIEDAKAELKKALKHSFGWEIYEGEQVDNFMVTHYFDKVSETKK